MLTADILRKVLCPRPDNLTPDFFHLISLTGQALLSYRLRRKYFGQRGFGNKLGASRLGVAGSHFSGVP